MSRSKMICGAAIAALATVGAGTMQTANAAYITGAPIVVDVGGGGAAYQTGTTSVGDISFNGTWTGTASNLVKTDGMFSDASFTMFALPQPGGFVLNTAGSGLVISGDVAATFPDLPARTFFGTWSGALGVSFSGLDPATAYNVDIYGGQLSGNAGAWVGNYSAGSNNVAGVLDSTDNTSNLLRLGNVMPDASGVLLIQVTTGIIGAMQLTPVVPEPASLGLLGLAGLAMMRRRK